MAEERRTLVAPFLRKGTDTNGMMLGMLGCLTLTAAHFAWRYDTGFFLRYLSLSAASLLIEVVYVILRDGRLHWPRASTAVTAALLVLSVPARMSWIQIFYGILVAVLFAKCMTDRNALRLNPMLVGRLFMMLLFTQGIQEWLNPSVEIDAFSSATPLGLYLAEDTVYNPLSILAGSIRGDWEGVYALVPGAPGEVMPLLALVFGFILYFTGIIDWRPGIAFILGFGLTCPILGMPLFFHLTAGSIMFTAVYIVTDPRSMPGSKAGRLIAGFLAGVINAVVRNHGYYPEGIVIAVLAVNLLSPTLDRLAFYFRGVLLQRATRRFNQ
ncbi:MAG: hypothetical protein EOM20_07090 [Spartobacteria bacterium]|nr:hypothetical protein [Spartobacteria bacterium]